MGKKKNVPTETMLTRTLGMPEATLLPRGGKNGTLTPRRYPDLANKFTVTGGFGEDLLLSYKGHPAGRMSWEDVLDLGRNRLRTYLAQRHTNTDNRVTGQGSVRAVGGWQFQIYVKNFKVGEDGQRYLARHLKHVYFISDLSLMAWGLGRLPSGFAFPKSLSHDKRDLQKAAAYALRRQINYIVWKLSESQQRLRVEEALENDREKLKMPA